MEQQDYHNRNNKIRGITFFSIGILVGIAICISIYLFENEYFKQEPSHSSDLVETPSVENKDSFSKKNNFKKKKSISQDSIINTDSLLAEVDSLASAMEENLNYDYGDFSLEEDMDEEYIDEGTIAEEKLELKKTIKVLVKNSELKEEENIPDNIIAYMEVQQWTSPIKNKISYKRDHNILNIKGLNIDNISIYYINGNYYLENGEHLFPIKENENYSKLSAIETAQL